MIITDAEEIKIIAAYRDKEAKIKAVRDAQRNCEHKWEDDTEFFESCYRYKCYKCGKVEYGFKEL